MKERRLYYSSLKKVARRAKIGTSTWISSMTSFPIKIKAE
jgi:hypothetical protein